MSENQGLKITKIRDKNFKKKKKGKNLGGEHDKYRVGNGTGSVGGVK